MRRWIRGMAAATLAAAAAADVTVKRVATTDGLGGAVTVQTTEDLKGTDRRSDSTSTFANGLMNKMAGGLRSQIVHVADDQVLDLNPAKKTYRQGTISEMGRKMEKARSSSGRGKDVKPTYRITRSSIKVDSTGEKKTVNGFPCQRVRLTMIMEVENIETHEKSEMRLVSDNWNAPETGAFKALREADAEFGKAFAKKMGLDLSAQEADPWGVGMAAMMGLSGDEVKAKAGEMKKELAKMKGVPVVTDIAWYSKREGAAQPKGTPPAAKADEDAGAPNLSGGAGGFAAGLAARMMKNKMQASADKSRASSEARASGEEPLFKSRIEIKEVKTGSVDDSRFQVPAGYKLEK